MIGAQSFLVKNDARSWHFGGNREMVFNYKRTGCVGINRERVNLNPAGVRLRGNKADVQFLHPVATNRNAVDAGQFRGLQPASYAAAIGRVRLYERQRCIRHCIFEFVDRMQVFPHGERHACGFGDATIAVVIVGDDGLFKPRDVVGLEGDRRSNRFVLGH